MKDGRILALDIGAHSVKMAEFAALKSGGIELVNFGVASLGVDLASEMERNPQITATIREIMQERSIRPGPAVISVSGQSVFSRFVKLPPVDKDKVHQIILYEAQQNVPFPIDEVVWDYQLIGRGEGELDVMLAAIKADIIVSITDAVQEAGIQTDLVDVAPMALYNAVRYNYANLTGCSLIIDIGARSTDLVFMEEGRVFIRSVPVAGNAITQQIMREFELSFDDAEEMKRAHAFVAFGGAYEGASSEVEDKVSKIVRSVMTRMHAEIDRSIKFYRTQQNGQQPSQILLTGGCAVIPYSDVFLKDKLKVDVDYLNPFINVPVAPNISTEDIGKNAHTMAQLVGVALRKAMACPIEINLLPPKVVSDKAFKRKQPLLVTAAFGLAAVILLWAIFFMQMTRLTDGQLAKVSERVQQLEAVERPLKAAEVDLAAVEEKLQSFDKLLSARSEWLDILSDIQKALPPGIWISRLSPDREPMAARTGAAEPGTGGTAEVPPGAVGAIELTAHGYTDEVTGATPITFRDNLRKSSRFSDKSEITWSPSPREGEFIRSFKIKVTLKQPITI